MKKYVLSAVAAAVLVTSSPAFAAAQPVNLSKAVWVAIITGIVFGLVGALFTGSRPASVVTAILGLIVGFFAVV